MEKIPDNHPLIDTDHVARFGEELKAAQADQTEAPTLELPAVDSSSRPEANLPRDLRVTEELGDLATDAALSDKPYTLDQPVVPPHLGLILPNHNP